MFSSSLKVSDTSSREALAPTATIIALIRLIGATRESRNDTMSLLAKRLISENAFSGEDAPSVIPAVSAHRDLANCSASTVCFE